MMTGLPHRVIVRLPFGQHKGRVSSLKKVEPQRNTGGCTMLSTSEGKDGRGVIMYTPFIISSSARKSSSQAEFLRSRE
jgi:hypothetical protein